MHDPSLFFRESRTDEFSEFSDVAKSDVPRVLRSLRTSEGRLPFVIGSGQWGVIVRCQREANPASRTAHRVRHPVECGWSGLKYDRFTRQRSYPTFTSGLVRRPELKMTSVLYFPVRVEIGDHIDSMIQAAHGLHPKITMECLKPSTRENMEAGKVVGWIGDQTLDACEVFQEIDKFSAAERIKNAPSCRSVHFRRFGLDLAGRARYREIECWPTLLGFCRSDDGRIYDIVHDDVWPWPCFRVLLTVDVSETGEVDPQYLSHPANLLSSLPSRTSAGATGYPESVILIPVAALRAAKRLQVPLRSVVGSSSLVVAA
jgi:hypothetical protein